jgi:pyruvate,water dikinase
MTRQMQLDMDLWRLAGRAIALGLKDTFLSTFEEDLQKTLESAEQGRAWLDELNRFLDVYGARTVIPLELHDRSWQENSTPVLGTIRAYVAQGGQYNFDRLLKDMAEERERLSRAVLDRISDPEAREKFRNLLESARKFQQAMEDDNYYFLWAGVQVRRVALEIGKRLAASGALDDPDDVFFLRKEEMERALVDLAAGLYDMSSYRKLARDCRAQWNEWCRVQPPPYIGDLPDELDDFMLTQFWGIRGRKQLDEAEGAVAGLGASGGVAEGVARLVFGPEEFGKIQPGEVLVCRSTNPAWTPVFSKISAVVTDQGGTLSHAAVVAREYGIPAVLGTQHATRRIPDGARVRVDGNTGKVELL